jgi:hypothetical protein
MTDIRNTEIKIRVGKNEDATTAITRYMKKNGFETEKWTDGKGLQRQYFFNNEYQELWIGNTNYVTDNTVEFTLNGNK